MGIWIGGLGRIGKQIQVNEKAWGVDSPRFLEDIDRLNQVVKLRNKVAHGDVMGDISQYLQDTITYAEELV